LRKELVRMFENWVLRGIFGRKRGELQEVWEICLMGPHNLYSFLSMIRMMKWRSMRGMGHVALVGKYRNSCRILAEKPQGKRPLGRPQGQLD
jgi:hypothetical protein